MHESAGRLDLCTGSDWAGAKDQREEHVLCILSTEDSFCGAYRRRSVLSRVASRWEQTFSATRCRLVREFVSQHRLIRSTQHEPTPR